MKLAPAGPLARRGGGRAGSGYIGDAGQAEAVAPHWSGAVKSRNPLSPLYLRSHPWRFSGNLADVAEPVATAIRDRLVPLADIATPNRFELERA